MKHHRWPKDRQLELENRKSMGESVASIAQSLNVTTKMASYHLKHVKPLSNMVDILPSYPSELLHIPDEPCALTADWHVPYFSMAWLERLIAVCDALGIKNLAIIGDFTDLSWISRFLRKDSRGGGLAKDIKVLLRLMETLLDQFENVWWNYGNHEDRMPTALRGHDPLRTIVEHLAETLDKGQLHTSAARTMLLGDHWRLEHPKSFSRDAAKVAVKVAAIYHKNVACGHGHHFGMAYDVSSEYLGIDLGGMFDLDKQEYLYNTGVTDMPMWTPGFWVYNRGKVRPFEDNLVNWEDFGVD